jgi:flagellar motor switch protein FliN/FliY
MTRAATDGVATAQIIALPDLHAGPGADTAGKEAAASILRDWHPLHQIKARLQVCVGEATLSVGELLAAKANQVLRLDRAVDQPIDLTIEGRVVARGQLVAVDGHFAVRITELPVDLDLTPGA